MMKKCIYVLSVIITCLFAFSCSSHNDMEKDDAKAEFSLLQEKSEANILSPVKYSLGGHFTGLDVNEFDSIVWHADGVQGKFYLLVKEDGHSTTTFSWTNHFTYPGKFTTHLDFYKEGTLKQQYTKIIEVVNRKDFLNLNWNSTDYESTVHVNVLDDANELRIHLDSVGNAKYAMVSLYREKEMNNVQLQKDKEFLSNYMTTLYGKPLDFVAGSHEIQQEYEHAFKYRYSVSKSMMIIHQIWQTQKNHIALAYFENEIQSYFAVIAEPR